MAARKVTHWNSMGTDVPVLWAPSGPCPTYLFIYLFVHLYPVSHPSIKLVNMSISLSSVFCSSKPIKPKQEPLEPLIYSQLARSTGEIPGLAAGIYSGGRKSHGTEPLTCGIRHFLQTDIVRNELNCRILSWCHRE